MANLIFAFRSFANASKKGILTIQQAIKAGGGE